MPDLYRLGLPPVPERLRSRPVQSGYPVPWFAARIEGRYDFRVADADLIAPAIKKRLCWICGQPLGSYVSLPIGPISALNRVTAEPPSHKDCADWAAVACPFLAQAQDRRAIGLPDIQPLPDYATPTQPPVTVVWTTKARNIELFKSPDGALLVSFGSPTSIGWFRQSRSASRAECLAAIDEGIAYLKDLSSGSAAEIAGIERRRSRLASYLPHDPFLHPDICT